MSLIYRILYQVGFTPWEQIDGLPASQQIEELMAQEEAIRLKPYGRALELGCGSGIWSIKLAARGWEVTGIDNVPKALRRARKRARDAGVAPQFLQGDVTELRKASRTERFDLVLDVGCFHELTDAQRASVGREVGAVATADATVLVMAWERGRRSSMLPHGVTREEIEAAFTGFAIVDDVLMDVTGAPTDVEKARPRWYRLRRSA
jgi:cyclopropane fatty-acyl-phospholipid synthase-like methyltransferase